MSVAKYFPKKTFKYLTPNPKSNPKSSVKLNEDETTL